MEIRNRVAVVTGAAGGIGSSLVQRLVEHGARVVATDLDSVRLDQVVTELSRLGPGEVVGRAGDAASEDHVRALVATAEGMYGPVDMYFANAGVMNGAGLSASDAEWEQALECNVMAHVRAARVLVPQWLERGGGYFCSTASAAGLLTQLGTPTYSVSKHGALAFAEWLSVTYGDQGVRVSCLCPMGVNTDMLNAGAEADDDSARVGADAVTGAGDVLEPLDVADHVMSAVGEERFLVLPHEQVREFFRRKGSDYERWLRGMRRYQRSLS